MILLCHRIPYPPNKGDKIRSFHLLQHLSRSYSVHLLAFVDDAADWKYAPVLSQFCESVRLIPAVRLRKILLSVLGLLRGQALSVEFYRSATARRWVANTIDENEISRVVVFSSAMGQFVPSSLIPGTRLITDFVDVDSDKWRQYADKQRWPVSWLYRREARLLANYERELALRSDVSFFVSDREAEFFREREGFGSDRCKHYQNGVDAEYFSPNGNLVSAYAAGQTAIVFTGAMDYWPNVDAVTWFVDKVFSKLRERHPHLLFFIVGGNPAREVIRLSDHPGVLVTGRVPDVRPYLNGAALAVAPIRVARGVQNKVLEAMAMALPVVVTSLGLEGIDARDGEQVSVADSAEEFLEKCELILVAGDQTGRAARSLVESRYGWAASLSPVEEAIEGTSADPQVSRDLKNA